MTTVLSIAYPFAPVGPNLVGGAEQILWDLDQALVTAGHRSLVVACEGSRPAGTLFAVPLPKRETLDEADREWCRQEFHRAVDRALEFEPVDLVHVHSMELYGYEFPPDVPVLITLHLPVEWYADRGMEKYKGRARFCYVSESQKRAGMAGFGDAPVIENGVEVQPLHAQRRKSDFALVMGRICPEKNAHSALEAGTKAHVRVIIGGQVYPYRAHQQYFEEKIEPQLVNSGGAPANHEFAGPLSPERRQQLLAEAKCLLHPTLAPETSSLVAMEALAAGTPVIAYRSGALPEIVEDGVTGFLVNDVNEMAEAIGKVSAISPEACHRAAERRFSKERMVERYFELYRSIIQESRGAAELSATRYRVLRSVEELSSFVPAWRRLWERDPGALPFQSPAWLVPWWRQFGNGDLCSVVVERGGEAVAFLPFYVYRDDARGKRQLLPLGVGTTDYLDGVFAPECSLEEIRVAIDVLRREAEHDEFCVPQMPEKSRMLQAVKEQGLENREQGLGTRDQRTGIGEQGLGIRGQAIDGPVFVSESEGCSRMRAVRMAELPQKIRRNAMYYRNRAQRSGRLELVQADESNWEEIFDQLRRLHALRWQTRGEEGVLVDERVVRWHREAIPELLKAGLLRLMALRLNDEVIAVLYSLIGKDPAARELEERTQYFYITAYSPEHADLRPGTLLIAYAVEHAANEGVKTIDMLRGDEGYKQIWHMEKAPTWCIAQFRQAAEHGQEETAA